jgi:hypothetical protein
MPDLAPRTTQHHSDAVRSIITPWLIVLKILAAGGNRVEPLPEDYEKPRDSLVRFPGQWNTGFVPAFIMQAGRINLNRALLERGAFHSCRADAARPHRRASQATSS